MRPLHSALILALAGLGPGLTGARGVEFTLFQNSWGKVVVATDMTPEGRALTPPTTEKPVYYLGRSLGEKLGTIGGDRLPDRKELNQLVTKILAQQGYLGAQPGVNDPTLYLIVQWGYLKPGNDDLHWFLGYDASRDIGSQVFPGQIGPEVYRQNFRSRETETILESAGDSIYGIIITAFEFKSARTATPIIYWQTRIGLPANGKSMAQALPTMFVAAGPAIGQPADVPVLRDADDARAGRVKLGELKILDVLNEPAASRAKK